MTGNSAHVSQYQFGDGCMLTVVEDEEKCAELLIAAEQTVAQKFSRYGKWPHRQVNLFVFENLQPLIEKLGQASRTLGENKESADNAYHGLKTSRWCMPIILPISKKPASSSIAGNCNA